MKIIDTETTGHRTLNGTDWPIETTLARVALPGRRPYWTVTREICNGTAGSVEMYSTLKAAREAL